MVTERVYGWGVLAVGLVSLGFGIVPRRSAAAALPLAHLPVDALIGAAAAAVPKPGRFAETLDVTTFQRGNVHTHSKNSDGDSPPADIYTWYRQHGYQWLALTDHNTLTNPAQFKLLERKGKFVIIPGEEVTMRGAGRQVHVNALCERAKIGGHHADTPAEALAWAVAQIHAAGGVALVNHPNWDWAFGAEALPGARGAELLEIFSGHPWVHQDGDEHHKSHEQIWDQALAAGLGFTGVAVDDAHTFKPRGPAKAARPGRGWVQVFAPEPRKDLICDALAKGRLYSSSGPALKRIAVDGAKMTVVPANAAATVEFVSDGGEVVKKAAGGEHGAAYELRGGESYVRARVTDPNGKRAWTAAYRVVPR
ncbi:MAG TPA: CehA/McbA family metallohydrolase [Minicystis sp.]|nr:CehA/McbA family metallohydrolase [Minicystis sp.]